MGHVTVKNCWKLIQAVQQLVISVLSDSMINCHRAHLYHLSCLGKPCLITVREAQVGQHSLYGRETCHLSSSLSVFVSLTQTHSFVTILLSGYCFKTLCEEQVYEEKALTVNLEKVSTKLFSSIKIMKFKVMTHCHHTYVFNTSTALRIGKVCLWYYKDDGINSSFDWPCFTRLTNAWWPNELHGFIVYMCT